MSAPGAPTKIAVLAMSTRKPRVGSKIAALVRDIMAKEAGQDGLEVKLVELADFKLPVYDEDVIPAQVPARAQLKHEHSKRWSAEVASHDAYVLVVPEYNGSVAGGAKNGIDYLHHEWVGKPAAVVSYGLFGGVNASAAVKGILKVMKLRVAETAPAFSFVGGVGPDAFAAMNGELGEETRRSIEAEKGTLAKVLDELKALLAAPADPPKKE